MTVQEYIDVLHEQAKVLSKEWFESLIYHTKSEDELKNISDKAHELTSKAVKLSLFADLNSEYKTGFFKEKYKNKLNRR